MGRDVALLVQHLVGNAANLRIVVVSPAWVHTGEVLADEEGVLEQPVVGLRAVQVAQPGLVLGSGAIGLGCPCCARNDTQHAVEVDRLVGYSLQKQLLVHHLLTVNFEYGFNVVLEYSGMLFKLTGAFAQRRNDSLQLLRVEEATAQACQTLRHQCANIASLHGFLQSLQPLARCLHTVEGHKQAENLIRAFKYHQNASVSHHPLVWEVLDEARASHNLKSLIHGIPHGLRPVDFCNRSLDSTIGVALVVNEGSAHISHTL
mmetsp:Transcript_42865/g.110531  ORF Transcript_42865/g.110531 Transcript_42865/m.110531 type:complete len:261 (-) Transcript_42865:1268-2050(-)